ncbi:MAG: Holliday junction resolvase RuvX [Planctomycetota bacterium]|nr:MAG: Holliday junction resolvase RuvX [Planctomycetota bacterium]
MAAPGRTLAIDYGGKRTGLAVSDPLGIAAHPLAAVISTDLEATVDAIARIAAEREVRRVVVGMPYLPSGLEGAQVDRVRLFIGALRPKLAPGIEILERDERLTTRAAEELWRQGGYSRREAKDFLDSTAAVILLRDYLAE